jgi:hypothetical protein
MELRRVRLWKPRVEDCEMLTTIDACRGVDMYDSLSLYVKLAKSSVID